MTAPSSLGKKKGKNGGGGKKPTRGGDVGLCNTLTGTHSLALALPHLLAPLSLCSEIRLQCQLDSVTQLRLRHGWKFI